MLKCYCEMILLYVSIKDYVFPFMLLNKQPVITQLFSFLNRTYVLYITITEVSSGKLSKC